MKIPEVTMEMERTLEEGDQIWGRRQEIALLSKDRYLLQDRNKPGLHKKLDTLRCWVEAVNTAEKEFQDFMPKGQTTVYRWLKASKIKDKDRKGGQVV